MPVAARLAIAIVLAGTLSACALGERPTLGETAALGGAPGSVVGDAGVDAVLGLLEQDGGADFTAEFALTRKLGPVEATGVVVRENNQESITVDDVRFLTGASPRTCSVSTGECEDGILDQRISDLGVGSAFWASGPARALRVAYQRRTGEPVPSSQDVAGVTVSCVDITVGPGVERYCASPAGTIAVWDTADKHIELTALRDTADDSAFTVPAG